MRPACPAETGACGRPPLTCRPYTIYTQKKQDVHQMWLYCWASVSRSPSVAVLLGQRLTLTKCGCIVGPASHAHQMWLYCWASVSRSLNVAVLLGQRRRRWTNTTATFGQRLDFAGHLRTCEHLTKIVKKY